MYAAPALTLSSKQVAELGVCWKSVIRRLFNYHKWESVKGVLHGLGRLNVAHFTLRKVKFYRHISNFHTTNVFKLDKLFILFLLVCLFSLYRLSWLIKIIICISLQILLCEVCFILHYYTVAIMIPY